MNLVVHENLVAAHHAPAVAVFVVVAVVADVLGRLLLRQEIVRVRLVLAYHRHLAGRPHAVGPAAGFDDAALAAAVHDVDGARLAELANLVEKPLGEGEVLADVVTQPLEADEDVVERGAAVVVSERQEVCDLLSQPVYVGTCLGRCFACRY